MLTLIAHRQPANSSGAAGGRAVANASMAVEAGVGITALVGGQ